MSENLPPPPLPRPNYHFACHTYTEDAMHAYARTACAQRDARIAELEAALKLADYLVEAFERDAVAADYYRDIHEFRAALKKEAP